jgi:pullulanase/glycogen debranching enzyme
MPDVTGTAASPRNIQSYGDPNPLWYKDAIIYQLHIKTFCDANKDGIGDFLGLLCRLDYIKNLGVTAIVLSPFYPSPLRDDGYDISDYFNVKLSAWQPRCNEHRRGAEP